MSAPGVRLFVAADLPDTVADGLAAWGAAAAAHDGALRALPAASLHVTLAFLGSRPPDEVDVLGAALHAVAGARPVPLRLAGALWLAPRRPHVLTVAVASPDGALAALHGRLLPALADVAAGWRPERRALRAHVTVARVRRGAQPRRDGVPAAPAAAFTAPSISLQRSRTGRGGAVYETLARVALPRA